MIGHPDTGLVLGGDREPEPEGPDYRPLWLWIWKPQCWMIHSRGAEQALHLSGLGDGLALEIDLVVSASETF